MISISFYYVIKVGLKSMFFTARRRHQQKYCTQFFCREIYCFLVELLGIFRILTFCALGNALLTVLNNFPNVYISTTPLTKTGNESLALLLPSLDIRVFMVSNHSVVRPMQTCVKLVSDRKASKASALIAATYNLKKTKLYIIPIF